MPRVTCSECNETFESRGFTSHNRHMHNGDAERLDPDDGAEPDDDAGTIDPDTVRQEVRDMTVADPDPDDGTDADPDDGAEDIETDDDPEDNETYNCAECGTELEYLEKECSGCGATPAWSAIDA